MKDFLNEQIKNGKCTLTEINGLRTIECASELTPVEIKDFLVELFNIESTSEQIEYVLDLKQLSLPALTAAIDYALTRPDLRNPSMILNILNLVKTYNTLNDGYFDYSGTYFKSFADLIEVKLDLQKELNKFGLQLSKYFISLFKSYNKTSYNPQDYYEELPNVFKAIIISSDILTLSGILTVSGNFSMEDCPYIENSALYLTPLLAKSAMSNSIMSSFFKELSNGDCA